MSQLALNAETQTLLRYLDAQREHILGILEGLDEAALRRPIMQSGWSCLGMVQHLALDVERFWFQGTVAGGQAYIDAFFAAPNDAWHVADDLSAEAVFVLYRQECARTNAIIAAASPDAAPAWWPPELFGEWRLNTVREIILHTMTETATHAGHLDAVRELLDGKQWLVLTS